MKFINKYLEFEMMEEGGVLIMKIKLIAVSNELIVMWGEFGVDDFFDVGFVETVLERALITECKTVIAFVL